LNIHFYFHTKFHILDILNSLLVVNICYLHLTGFCPMSLGASFQFPDSYKQNSDYI